MFEKCESWSLGRLQVFSHSTIVQAIGSDVFKLADGKGVNEKMSRTLETVLNKITAILGKFDGKHSTVSLEYC